MNKEIPQDYLQRLYAGWLGKIIGVRHGSNTEGWSYDRIQKTFGEITTYPYDFKNFAADDDTNGPMFFLRALEDYTYNSEITAEQMGLTLINYVADGHGFFWWGGYGNSTEHTGYSNVKSGIMAPRSGSIQQNGVAVAEQIGGQIFSDVWGLINPGNPELAAEYAEKMSSVTHGGNGIYGGQFVAACIAEAFVEKDIEKVILKGLSLIPADCEYTRMATAVIKYFHTNPEDWRKAFKYVEENFGYHLYPGVCHIIPNSAVMILAMMYGEGDFSKTINIGNMCGWDTDCNVGNIGTILGVLNGLEGIDKSWREPINDFLCASSVIGSLNIVDIPSLVSYTASFAYKIAGEEMPEIWKDKFNLKERYFHFELPGSTHGFRSENLDGKDCKMFFINTEEASHSGNRSLKFIVPKANSGSEYRAFYQTYYAPEDFNDNRYEPEFSPVLYPGQTIEVWTMLPSQNIDIRAAVYIKDRNTGNIYKGEIVNLVCGEWTKLTYSIPYLKDAIILQAGIEYFVVEEKDRSWDFALTAYIDDMRIYGKANYSIDFRNERMECWDAFHKLPSQMTYARGIWGLEDGELSGSYCGDSAEAYTGDFYWENYSFEANVIPKLGEYHNINFRVQGAIRSYAIGLSPFNKIELYKNNNGYLSLSESEFIWEIGKYYNIRVDAFENEFKVYIDGKLIITYKDEDKPYLHGAVGFSNFKGSHTHYKSFKIQVK
ncbi:MAG: ADP-ribosylglycohydrolase family protein [Clostridium sp.]|uniref:ADP-ribosylglycohydrolase family protein n=1 Tax=Clostridium sp. TaxID=1506 RepID=UPI003D6D9DFC